MDNKPDALDYFSFISLFLILGFFLTLLFVGDYSNEVAMNKLKEKNAQRAADSFKQLQERLIECKKKFDEKNNLTIKMSRIKNFTVKNLGSGYESGSVSGGVSGYGAVLGVLGGGYVKGGVTGSSSGEYNTIPYFTYFKEVERTWVYVEQESDGVKIIDDGKNFIEDIKVTLEDCKIKYETIIHTSLIE